MTELVLKPCPFCGGPASHNDGGNSVYGRFWWTVGCASCGISFTDREFWVHGERSSLDPNYPPKECFDRWNQRAGEPPMTDLIKAADALAEELENRIENGCEICNGDCGSANPPVQSCPQQRRTKLLTAYRQARESADGVKVKPLVWSYREYTSTEEYAETTIGCWVVWTAKAEAYYKSPGSDTGIRVRGGKEAAKAAAQADYEARIKAALVPND